MKFILQLTNNLFNIIKDNEIVRNKYIYIYRTIFSSKL